MMGAAFVPIFCKPKPRSRATNSTWRMLPSVSDENSEVGMMPSRKSAVPSLFDASASYVALAILRPSPGWMKLPTTMPMPRANVDIVMK